MTLFKDDEPNTTISFRLPEAAHDKLRVLVELSGQATKHQVAKTILIAALEGRDQREIIELLQAILRSLESTRGALGRGVGAILMQTSEIPNSEIKDWVFSVMLRLSEEPSGGEE